MYEAILRYDSGHVHRINASTIETLKEKCKHFMDNPKIYVIEVNQIKGIGHFKCDLLESKDLL